MKKECNKEKRLKKKGALSIKEKMAQCQEGQAMKYAIVGTWIITLNARRDKPL